MRSAQPGGVLPADEPTTGAADESPGESSGDIGAEATRKARAAATATARLYDVSFVLAILAQTSFVIGNTLMAHHSRWVTFLGGTQTDVGWVRGFGAVAGMALRPLIGQWINRFGAQRIWFLGFVVFGVGAGGNLFVTTVGPLLYFYWALNAIGAALVFAASLTYAVHSYPERRTEAIGILGVGGFLGMIFGPFSGDLILGVGERSRGDFEFLFIMACVALVVPALIMFALRRPDVRRVEKTTGFSEFLAISMRFWPGAIVYVAIAFGVCMTAPFVFLPNYIDADRLHLPVSPIGLFFCCYAGWGVTLRVVLRRLPDHIGRRKVLMTGMSIMAVGMISFVLVTRENPWLLAAPGLICGTAHSLIFHTMSSLSIEKFPNEYRGTGSALTLMMMDLGMVAGAPLLGAIADTWGFRSMFLAISACSLGAVAIYVRDSLPIWRAKSA
ncbi:MAG: MFS transporter [Pirellulaceae bacterium]|nr:MFS transporter [Pirellulaceae bacterium]MDP7019595.1 MFS transporter [Pirellulaceae bacterium]